MLHYLELLKVVFSTGISGLLILLVWKFADKWAGRFLESSTAQAAALTSLAASVKDQHDEQREVLIAVQVMASKIDEVRGSVRELDSYMRARGAMQTDVERVRRSLERGEILRVLKVDFCAAMTTVKTLRGALALGGFPLSFDGLAFHLEYLAQQGYVEAFRAKNMPGYRADRVISGWQRPESILSAKLMPRGLLLIDGLAPEDPAVSF